MAYLGRISAVLTANTQNFRREIGNSRRDLLNFARQARGTQFNLDNRALNGTLTNLQRFRAELQAIRRLRAQGLGVDLPNPRRLRDQFRLFEDLGRPLTEVKNRIEGLSNSIQAELSPELFNVQLGFRRLYREISRGSTTFDASAARIDNLRQRLIGLSRATAALSDLNSLTKQLNSNNAGASFFTPRAQEALQRSLALRGQAQSLPSRFRENGAFADLAVLAEENAERIERAAARVARAQLRVINEGANPRTISERGRRQAELDALTRQQQGINLGFERQIASARIQQIVSPEAVRPVDALIERAGALAAKLRENNDTRFEPLIASVGRVIERLNQGEASARRAKQAVDALAGTDFSKAFAASSFKDADKILRTDSERTIAEIRKNAADERRQAIGRVGNLSQLGPNRTRAIEDINRRESIALDRENFNRTIVGSIGSLRDRVERSRDPRLAQGFDNIRSLARDVSSGINGAFDETEPNRAATAVEAYRLKMASLSAEVAKFERAITSAETANKRFAQFLEISGSRSDKLGSSLTRFASDISVTRQFAGNLDPKNIAGRAAIERRIEADLKFAEKASRAQQRIADSTRMNDAVKDSRRRRIDDIVARRRADSVGVLVDASGGEISRKRAEAAMDRQAKRQGSFSVGGSAAAQLAFQQGLFAIDDFISSTGGLEYKLRAVGNNITQLGLLLGQSGLIPGLTATTGLFVSLGVVLAGQAAVGILKWVSGAEQAEDQTKALNEALSKQQSLVEKIASSFESLSDTIVNRAFAPGERAARDFAKSLEELARSQRELRESRAGMLDPQAAQSSLEAESLSRRLAASTDAGQSLALAQARARAQASARRAARDAAERPADFQNAINAIGAPPGNAAERSRQREAIALQALRSSLPGVISTPLFFAPLLFNRRASVTGDVDARQALRDAGADRDAQIRAILSRQNEIRRLAGSDLDLESFARGDSIAITGFAREFRRLEAELNRLLDAAGSDAALVEFLQSIETAGSRIETAQGRLAEAIDDGATSLTGLQRRLSQFAQEIADSRTTILNAQKEFIESDQGAEARLNRDEVVKSEQEKIAARVKAMVEEADAANIATAAVRRFAEALDRASQEAQANLSSAQQAADSARALDLGFSTPMSRDARQQADRDLQRQRELASRVEQERAAAQERLGADAVAEAVRQRRAALAQEALANGRREQQLRQQFGVDPELTEWPGIIADLREKGQDEAADEVEKIIDRQGEILKQLGSSVENFWKDVRDAIAAQPTAAKEVIDIVREIAQIEAQLASVGVLSDGQREQLASRRAQLEQRFIEADARVQDGVNASTREEQRRQAAIQGRELSLTPGDRIREDLARGRAAIDEFFNRQIDAVIEDGDGLLRDRDRARINDLNRQRDEAQQRNQIDGLRQAAPAIFGLADQVQNALLQGPSRAALAPIDVSTVEGSRELTRLLRGDDAARDQASLVELQKQANELLRAIAQNPAGIAP